jgi:hypothetical protein
VVVSCPATAAAAAAADAADARPGVMLLLLLLLLLTGSQCCGESSYKDMKSGSVLASDAGECASNTLAAPLAAALPNHTLNSACSFPYKRTRYIHYLYSDAAFSLFGCCCCSAVLAGTTNLEALSNRCNTQFISVHCCIRCLSALAQRDACAIAAVCTLALLFCLRQRDELC